MPQQIAIWFLKTINNETQGAIIFWQLYWTSDLEYLNVYAWDLCHLKVICFLEEMRDDSGSQENAIIFQKKAQLIF